MILAGDIGGTKTLLGLFTRAGRRLRLVRLGTFASGEHRSLEEMVRDFLGQGRERVRRCAVGVAGPVVGGRSQVVNLPWSVDSKRLARGLRLPWVEVLNDLEATAWGVPELLPRQLLDLTPGVRPQSGNAAVIAAGTGLGMAILFWDGRRHRPSASEGGHQGFAPRDELETELLRFVRKAHGRASLDRMIAGPGLHTIYRFLVETGRGAESPSMRRRLSEGDPNAAISEAGVAGEDPLAERAVDLFVSLYGAAAGDLALVARATAGIYVGGGIAPKMLPKLRSGSFLRSFREKGRLTPFVERIPVRVILEPRTALLGAAACAAHGLGKPFPSAARPRGSR